MKAKSADFHDIESGAWKSGIFMYYHLRDQYRDDYPASGATTGTWSQQAVLNNTF
jgi:hypothetical protein